LSSDKIGQQNSQSYRLSVIGLRLLKASKMWTWQSTLEIRWKKVTNKEVFVRA